MEINTHEKFMEEILEQKISKQELYEILEAQNYKGTEDVEDWHYDSEKEVLRGPMEIKPTKITNLVTTAIGARNTLAIGHRFRGDVGEVIQMANFVCSVWSPIIAFILAGAYLVCLVRDYRKGELQK